jgi:predicted short-subunit dehydrogenase-like oxidoreductase (DUF2520 family)
MKPTIGIVGAGKVGGTLARLCLQHGYHIGAVYSREAAKKGALAQVVGADAATSAQAVVAGCDLTLLTVPDDALVGLASAIRMEHQMPAFPRAVVHTSGAQSMEVLKPLAEAGLMTGSLHPAYPFASVESALHGLEGAAYALEAEHDLLRDWLHDLVLALGGRVIQIPPGKKALYHAALVMASNYTVGLYGVAKRLLMSLGAERGAEDAALNALLAGTIANLQEKGVPNALTGPLVRGDAGTIRAHLAALDADTAALYRLLALATLPLAEARGVDTTEIRQTLEDFYAREKEI